MWCYGCKKNLTCFINAHYAKMKIWKPNRAYFVVDNHFYPQSWFCGFSTYLDQYTILRLPKERNKLDDFYDELGAVIRSKGVDEAALETIRNQLTKRNERHSTVGQPERKFYDNWLYSDKTLMKILLKVFYYDYIIFGFDFPKLN